MKVRNIVRGAVLVLSLGLASVETGMGLTANEFTETHAQPGYTVGPGGGSAGNHTYSTPPGSTPYGNGVWHEISYVLGRFGLLGYCASAGPQSSDHITRHRKSDLCS
jgi:hypothetical protein